VVGEMAGSLVSLGVVSLGREQLCGEPSGLHGTGLHTVQLDVG